MNVPTSIERPPGEKGEAPGPERPPEDLGDGYVVGNLTADPELRFTPSGRAIANLRVAYSPRVKDPDTGNWRDGEPAFYTINVWGQQGEHCAETLQRGDRIVAAGTWQRRYWTDREGAERENTELTARDIGPSLLFRVAAIKRTERKQGGGHSE